MAEENEYPPRRRPARRPVPRRTVAPRRAAPVGRPRARQYPYRRPARRPAPRQVAPPPPLPPPKPVKKRVWHWILLSFLIPILGGIIAFLAKKDEDHNLAAFCMVNSIFNPLLLFLILDILFPIMGLPYISYPFTVILGIIICVVLIKGPLSGNEYRYFLLVSWFSLIGALITYYGTYSKDKNLQSNVGWYFFFSLVVMMAFFVIVLAGVMLFVGSMYGPGAAACPEELMDRYYDAESAYNIEMDRESSIFDEWLDLEEIYITIDCSNVAEFRKVRDDHESWISGPYKDVSDRALEAAQGLANCDVTTYTDAILASNTNDDTVTGIQSQFNALLEEFEGMC